MKVLEKYGVKSQLERKGIVLDALDVRSYKDGRLLSSRPVNGTFAENVGGPWMYDVCLSPF